jgi:hypothetical protein
MAVVNFGGDRGLVIFSMMTNGDARPERLMALVCIVCLPICLGDLMLI